MKCLVGLKDFECQDSSCDLVSLCPPCCRHKKSLWEVDRHLVLRPWDSPLICLRFFRVSWQRLAYLLACYEWLLCRRLSSMWSEIIDWRCFVHCLSFGLKICLLILLRLNQFSIGIKLRFLKLKFWVSISSKYLF